jgi:hypothetical protein
MRTVPTEAAGTSAQPGGQRPIAATRESLEGDRRGGAAQPAE